MKIFLFYFEMAIKITGSAQNYRVRRVSGNTPIIFFLGLIKVVIIMILYALANRADPDHTASLEAV